MGIGSRVLASRTEYEAALTPGHMWMALLEGRPSQLGCRGSCGRAALVAACHRTAERAGHVFGTLFWTVHAARFAHIEDYCGAWIRRHLAGYTGLINIETIGGRMIEVHLRMSDQWPDLYGPGWVDAVIRLYHRRHWAFADQDRRDGYSVVLFGPHGPRYRHPPAALVAQVQAAVGRVERADHLP